MKAEKLLGLPCPIGGDAVTGVRHGALPLLRLQNGKNRGNQSAINTFSRVSNFVRLIGRLGPTGHVRAELRCAQTPTQ